jgi:hypothetical protein
MGIDSRWVVEHPDRFISLNRSPFPTYSFTGPDVSDDERVGIYLEDGYYDRSDAAVVFKRADHWTGDERYVYHGNDGTSMPWNDTAQLNFLKEEVREAVTQMILRVARKFPIIRFDAAMTLAKKHYQRLWFPEPGTGGAIPSRADHGLAREKLNELMPAEFWRQVVDRVAKEVPDTLLLAEAFWLMEGYFVRTLGMHRVYNSAFMNMLRDEDNAKYRRVMKNTLEFDTRIMKRYVNFMNNPDERTTVDQFGKGDKYFGICAMLATMPGLPMFGHGQIEGYAEKYGMEYRRAYWDESPDRTLVKRHERDIFPLLHRRHLFAGVENFLLYDFFTPGGHVNEDVFAYSNGVDGERALVLYHNKYAETRGWVRTSVAYAVQDEDGERHLLQRSLGEGLRLRDDVETFTVFRDQVSGLEYIRSNREVHERGLYAELGAYKSHVFLDFRQVRDTEWHQFAQLTSYLDGRGVPSIDEALKEVLLRPVHQPFRELVNADTFQRLLDARVEEPGETVSERLIAEIGDRTLTVTHEAKQLSGGSGDEASVASDVERKLETILLLPALEGLLPVSDEVADYVRTGPEAVPDVGLHDNIRAWSTLLSWLFTHSLGRVANGASSAHTSRSWQDEWLLGKIMASVLEDLGLDEGSAWWAVATVKVLTAHQRWFETHCSVENRSYRVLKSWLGDNEVQSFLQVNRYQDVLWFNDEAFDQLLWWMSLVAIVGITSDADRSVAEAGGEVTACYHLVKQLQQAKDESGYRLERLLQIARA